MTGSETPPSKDPSARSPGSTGSPSSGESLFLAVGKLRRPHGVEGELQMEIFTDFPERLRKGVTVYVGEEHLPLRIHTRREHGMLLLLSFKGYDTPETASELTNSMVYVRASDRPPLPEGEYYHHQLLGLKVMNLETGEQLGILKQILDTGANDVYIILPEAGPEILIPAIQDVVKEIDLSKGEIRILPLPGLLPE